MLAKRCAPELGSDRRPRRCVSPDTTWRFCARRDSVCLWSSSADILRMVCRRVAYLDGTTAGGSRTGRGTRTPHPLPRVAWLKRCARQLLVFARHFPHVRLPSSPLHKQERPAGVAFRHACVWISMDSLACLSKPSGPTGHDRWLWVCLGNAAHVIATIPGPGQWSALMAGGCS